MCSSLSGQSLHIPFLLQHHPPPRNLPLPPSAHLPAPECRLMGTLHLPTFIPQAFLLQLPGFSLSISQGRCNVTLRPCQHFPAVFLLYLLGQNESPSPLTTPQSARQAGNSETWLPSFSLRDGKGKGVGSCLCHSYRCHLIWQIRKQSPTEERSLAQGLPA